MASGSFAHRTSFVQPLAWRTGQECVSSSFHENNDSHNDDGEQKHKQRDQDPQFTFPNKLKCCRNSGRQPSDDACKDYERDAVTDPTFGNLLAQPHNKSGTRG